MCSRQVLTPVNTSQLLIKLESLDKLRLVTFHKLQHKETALLELVHTNSNKFRRNECSHDFDSQSVELMMLAA